MITKIRYGENIQKVQTFQIWNSWKKWTNIMMIWVKPEFAWLFKGSIQSQI